MAYRVIRSFIYNDVPKNIGDILEAVSPDAAKKMEQHGVAVPLTPSNSSPDEPPAPSASKRKPKPPKQKT